MLKYIKSLFIFILISIGCKKKIAHNHQSTKIIIDSSENENKLKETQEEIEFQRVELNEIKNNELDNMIFFKKENFGLKISNRDSIREYILYDNNNIKQIFKKNEIFEGIGLESSLYKFEKDSLLVVDNIYEYSETFQIFRLKNGELNFIEEIDVDTDIEKAEKGIKTSSLFSIKKSNTDIRLYYSESFIKMMKFH
ncbi:hypothetical protein [Aquimarina sp. RZ0]|uniref:hypothetical protein n=1 Tax=Aquimarina sp. RZ0 TaxID=2607730 RepID=UPI0011F1D1E9|nr:hypothetical protein [Aquimarina sp. RZ0]KAA1242362.1 hypothetical protein F0000_25970 [Aquimarina sp. RZ0]